MLVRRFCGKWAAASAQIAVKVWVSKLAMIKARRSVGVNLGRDTATMGTPVTGFNVSFNIAFNGGLKACQVSVQISQFAPHQRHKAIRAVFLFSHHCAAFEYRRLIVALWL